MKLSEILKKYAPYPDFEQGNAWKYRVRINGSGSIVGQFVLVQIEAAHVGYLPDEPWDDHKSIWFDFEGKIIMIEGRYAIKFYGETSDAIDKQFLSMMIAGEPVVLDIDDCAMLPHVTVEGEPNGYKS